MIAIGCGVLIFGSPTSRPTVTPVRPHTGRHDGLAYALWLPPTRSRHRRAGVVVVHGAGSAKESHYDFARAAIALGLAALTFDQRGHGESEGRFDDRAVTDVVAMAGCCARQLAAPAARWPCAARAWAAIWPSARPVRRGPAPWWRSARPAGRAAPCAPSPELPWRTDPGARSRLLDEDPWPRRCPRSTSRCCSCTPRATSGCRSSISRELATGPRAPRAAG